MSSVNRMYIPMSILSAQDVVADSAIALYNVELWIFAILESRMHMVWMKFVGGRLKRKIIGTRINLCITLSHYRIFQIIKKY